MKLIPDESVQGLRRILVTALWGLGTLLLGTLVIAAVGLLLGVSSLTPLGIWSGLAVLVLACVVTWIVWRQAPSGGSRRSSWADEIQPLPPRPLKPRDTRIPTPPPTAPPTAAEYKRRFNKELEAGNLDAAERIVAEMDPLPGEGDWCANARRRLQFKRARRS